MERDTDGTASLNVHLNEQIPLSTALHKQTQITFILDTDVATLHTDRLHMILLCFLFSSDHCVICACHCVGMIGYLAGDCYNFLIKAELTDLWSNGDLI